MIFMEFTSQEEQEEFERELMAADQDERNRLQKVLFITCLILFVGSGIWIFANNGFGVEAITKWVIKTAIIAVVYFATRLAIKFLH